MPGVQTISLVSELPWITDPVTVAIPLYKGKPQLELNGAKVGGTSRGLCIFNTGNCTISGLIINRFFIGIHVSVCTAGNVISNNYIGTDASGTQMLSNNMGIQIFYSPDNQIGVFGRNVISGNGAGVLIAGGSGNVVQGNYIGTDASGSQPLSNFDAGIWIKDAGYNQIGGIGTPPNVISGNGGGIRIDDSSGIVVQGNYIGVDKTGLAAFGNFWYGVRITNSSYNRIGSTSAGAGNVIAYNGVFGPDPAGVRVENGIGNTIRGNSIFSQIRGLGIDLAPDGVTPSDLGDGDTGANNLQNYPDNLDAASDGVSTVVSGRLSSTPNTEFTIDFYSNQGCGNGEGETYLFSRAVFTNSSGYAYFSFFSPVNVAVGRYITATATAARPNPADTSEFSPCAAVHPPA